MEPNGQIEATGQELSAEEGQEDGPRGQNIARQITSPGLRGFPNMFLGLTEGAAQHCIASSNRNFSIEIRSGMLIKNVILLRFQYRGHTTVLTFAISRF